LIKTDQTVNFTITRRLFSHFLRENFDSTVLSISER